ncbi:MAG TPA: DUF1800 domain-containing protein [Blastocatellia bacterium]|nr:DUF1800 domain-containing protein [Blastocatellia bacterium]
MRFKIRQVLSTVLAFVLLSPLNAFAQGGPPFEPFVTRIRDALKLNDDQVKELRQILAKHEPKITELRRRAQATPYAPGLAQEVEREQRVIREEFATSLDEDQKTKLASVDARVPVPLAPPFVLVNIPPRERGAIVSPLASAERAIPAPVAPSKGKPARLTEDQKLFHLLNRVTFGPRPGDLERVKRMGIAAFLEEQLQPDSIDDSQLETRLAVLPTQRMTSAELYQFYPPPNVADERAKQPNPPPVFGRPQQMIVEQVQQKLVRAVSSNRQLQEVMTDFWFNHFNVFAPKEAEQWMVASYERDVIRPNSLGKFRDLLLATAMSPAMLFYLDNWLSTAPDARQPRPPAPPRQPGQSAQSAKPAPGAGSATPSSAAPPGSSDTAMMRKKESNQNPQSAVRNPQSPPPAPPQQPQRPRGINENYARELLELHTLGVDGGYTQKDVQEVARCFTGWTIDKPFQGGGFVFRPWMHDTGAKTVLGVTIPAGGGISDAIQVIDILSRHPSTARFISKKLCQRFVCDEPPPELVERVAQVFLKTTGNIREVLRTILTSAEFNSPAMFRAKVKSPLELAASAIRAVDGDTNGAPALHEWVRRMGEPLYLYAFPTGYKETSESWMNTGVFFNRINFVVALANGQINGTSYEPFRLVSNIAAANAEKLTSQLAPMIVHTELSPESQRAVLAGLTQPPSSSSPQPDIPTDPKPAVANGATPTMIAVKTGGSDAEGRKRVAQAMGLLLGTAEFQRR